MTKKLRDDEKVRRVKEHIEKALRDMEHNYRDRNVLNVVSKSLCDAYAIIQTDTDDQFLIENISVQTWLKVNGVKQLEFDDTGKVIKK